MTMPYQSKQQSAYISNVLPDSIRIQLQNAKDLAVNRLLRPNSFSNVVGVGIGRKLVGDEVTDTRCVRIYVQSKRSLYDLSPAEVVPSTFLDIPTDIINVGRLGRPGNPSDHLRDNQKGTRTGPGSSIRLKSTSPNVNQGAAGTLGAVVRDGEARYVLSCNHILSLNGRVGPEDTCIVTPALSHKPTHIAQASPHFIELKRGQRNSVDCALAPLVEPPAQRTDRFVQGSFRPAPLSGRAPGAAVASPSIGEADRGQKVIKDGAITGLTSGTVVDVNADFYVEYSFGTFLFANQIVIAGDNDTFAADGDSGSIVIYPEVNQAIAMIFAESGRFAIACPLTEVLNQLREKANAPNLSLESS